MKRVVFLIFVSLFFIKANAIIEESGSLNDFLLAVEENSAYSKWVSHIVEGIAEEGYNMYAPYDRQTDGFGQFTLPSESQSDIWDQAVDYFFNEEYNNAHNLLVQNNIPYSVVKFTDGDDIYYMLRENLNLTYTDDNGTSASFDDEIGSFDFGWGIYIYRTTSPNPILVTAPHPNDDFVTPYLSVQSFQELNAQYLMINGSGREVMWSEWGSYSNNKSLSDPSRNHDHPFNYFYAKACDKIRSDFDRRELSVQLHSYDWDSHPNRASCQVSPGQYNRPAGLPIRDFSPLQQDLIQYTDYIVVPQASIGNNEQVVVSDYYSVHNYFYPTIYQDTLEISSQVDLPGYPNSFHDQYSTSNFSEWDVFSPFFHVEFDELPNCYSQNEESFKEFYGFNSYNNSWNMLQRYTKLASYYQPFLTALTSSVADWIEFDDGLIPEAPTNLRRYYGGGGNSIAWDLAPAYDFYSYEILYSLDPISENNYSIVNREQVERLAYPMTDNASLPDLEINQTYYMAMRTRDYNGNVSELSEEIIYNTLPIITSEFDFFASDSNISFDWSMSQQQNCLGFEVYRKEGDSDFALYSSYENNSDLQITSPYTQFFSFTDTNVEITNIYAYKVHVVNTAGTSGQISQIMHASLASYINLASTGNSWDESITFGKSYYATDSYDDVYDQMNESTEDYLAINADNQKLTRNIIGDFDPLSEVRYMDLIINNPPENLTFSLDAPRLSERFYLEYAGNLYSLTDQEPLISFPEPGNYELKLIWGNLQAQVSFPNLTSAISYQGSEIDLNWELDYPQLVNDIDLYFTNGRDSIFVASNLPATISSFNYLNDNSEDYRMMNLMVSVNASDGQIIDYKSYSRFVLISEIQELNLSSQSANYLFSYPFIDDLDLALYQENLQAYSFFDEEFTTCSLLSHNNAYLINVSNDQNIPISSLPYLESSQYQLNQGWNHISNPHPLDYAVKDFLFEVNGLMKSYKTLVNSQMILPAIIGVRDGAYTRIDTLRAFESAFLCQVSNSLINIRFDPVNLNENFTYEPAQVFFTLQLKTLNGAKDEVTIGLQNNLTPVIDFYYDVMKAPLRPSYGLTEAYIVSQPPLSNYYPKMHQKMLDPSREDTYQWDLAFTNTLDQAVQIRIKESNNPDNYPLDLNMGNNQIRLTNVFQTIPETDESGNYEAQLTITTITDNENNDVFPVRNIQVSPNPISKIANIYIPNTKNTSYSLTIYNLKGQKVKDFHVQDCKEENTNLKWDLTNNQGQRVSSGVYFLKYKDEISQKIRKICVMK
jgi:hypothetical protein